MSETFIALNDKIINYFGRTELTSDIRRIYEQGKLVIIDKLDFFGPYKKFLDTQVVGFYTDDIKIKKIKGNELLKAIDKEHLLLNFTKDPFELQRIILDSYVWVKQTVLKLFPGYHILSENWTWQLTTVRNEPMHLDSYVGQNNDLHNVRVFINLDNQPRVWRVSYPLIEIYKKNQDLIRSINKLTHPNEINNILNEKISWYRLPYHEVYFAPYSMWLCNTQLIPHQPIRGGKLAAFTFRISPDSMLHPELTFEKVARHYQWCVFEQQLLF